MQLKMKLTVSNCSFEFGQHHPIVLVNHRQSNTHKHKTWTQVHTVHKVKNML